MTQHFKPPEMDVEADSLFDTEERVVEQTDLMLKKLEEVSESMRMLAGAHGQAYSEQKRMVRVNDRMQAELQAANRQMQKQAERFEALNETLQREIEKREDLADELRRLATEDQLTGLATRRHLFDLAQQQARHFARNGGPLTVLVLDLDGFKDINDQFGHATGDRILQRFAEICTSTLREVDIVGRIGGDEFAIVLPGSDLAASAIVANRIRQRVERELATITDYATAVTVSMGGAEFHPTDTVDTVLGRADTALYQAKHLGRNQVIMS
ncbi:MAG: GGDEF domain-containing protein [Aquisalimonadaceae bacterium]